MNTLKSMTHFQLLRFLFFGRFWHKILILLSALFGAIFLLIAPLAQKFLMDFLTHKTSLPIQAHISFWQSLTLSILFLFLALALNQLTNWLALRESLWAQSFLAQKIYLKTLELRMDSLGQRQIGEIVSLYATDVPGATFLIEQTFPVFFTVFFPLILTPIFLHYFFNVPLTPLLICMIFIFVLNVIMGTRQSFYFQKFKILAAKRMGMVSEWLINIRTLRILNWTSLYESKIFHLRKIETENRVGMVTNGQTMNALASSITFVLTLTVLYSLSLNPLHTFEKSEVLFLMWVLGIFLTRPFRQMPWLFTFALDGWTSLRRLSDFLAIKNIENYFLPNPTGFTQMPVKKDLQVEGLNLQIHGKEILKDLSFQIHEGEFVAVVGEVGSGKSSLLLSLFGETGASFRQYTIGGIQAKNLPLFVLKSFFSYVPQEGFIMSSTLRDNVGFQYDLPSSQDAVILESLRKSEFDLSTERVSAGLDSEIGERGINLSGGQKQRISLARVQFFQTPILLLDDCVSAVDVETEKRLLENLFFQEWKNKTRILATHRLSILPHVHRILFLKDGFLRSQGTFQELLSNDPEFVAFTSSLQRKNMETVDHKMIAEESKNDINQEGSSSHDGE